MHTNGTFARSVLAVTLLVALPLAAETSGSILAGRVTDPSGAAVPGATVVASGEAGQVQVGTTGVDGRYTLSGVAPGACTVRINAPGFALFEKAGVNVSGARHTLDAQLTLDVARQEVTVSDNATVDTQPSSNVGAVVLKGDDLEMLSDDPDDLEADLQALAGPAAGPNGGQIYVDGFTGGTLPPKASIREVRINQNPFSAEFDRLGFGRIEIFTKPGSDRYHGQAFFNFGDARFNSRNPFAVDKPDSQMKMFSFNFGGPLTRKSSFFIDADRHSMEETSVVSALTLDDAFRVTPFSASVLSPRTRTSVSPRFDLQLAPNHTLVARYSYSRNNSENSGVGELALPSRAVDTFSADHNFRVTETAVLGTAAINETRFQYNRRDNRQTAAGMEPGISVLGAFTGGGAATGLSHTRQNGYELDNSTSMTRGAHLIKFGGRLRQNSESGSSMQGYNGAFTFTSLDAYRITLLGLQNGLSAAGIRALGGGASQFSITGGNPVAKVSQFDVGLFFQDDWRVRQNFTLSMGLRYEAQNNIGDHLDIAQRIGFAWGIGRRGSTPKTVIRGGVGLFYDRVDESLVLQAIRLNGINQQQFVVPFPDFFPNVPGLDTLAANRLPTAVRELSQTLKTPYVAQGVLSVERQLPKNVNVAVTYAHSRGMNVLRSRNINAPLPGTWNAADPSSAVRPYGNIGDIYLYESGGRYTQRQLMTNVNARISPKLTLFGFYVLGKAEGNADGASDFPANQYDLTSEWGRSGFDVRHRFMLGGSVSGPFRLRFNPFVTASSGRPFDITLGRDLNGDSRYNERPAFATDLTRASVVRTAWGAFDLDPITGQTLVPRNYGSGPGQFSVNLRLSRTFSFGSERAVTNSAQRSGASGPSPMMMGGGGQRGGGGGGMRGGGLGGPGGMFGEGGGNRRYSITLSASARNLLNNVNLGTPIGNLSSPLFGASNSIAGGFGPGGGSAAANRRIEFQLRFSF